MNENILFVLIVASVLGCGLMAGIFFAFSNFVMAALARIEPLSGVSAMQSINRVILNPLFFILFFGSAAVSVLLLVALFLGSATAESAYVIAGCFFYLLGVMLVTVVYNVPMNNTLERLQPASDEAAAFWPQYVARWTRWNHVRTVASFFAMLLFVLALI